jgi:hypothetical protein
MAPRMNHERFGLRAIRFSIKRLTSALVPSFGPKLLNESAQGLANKGFCQRQFEASAQ